MVSLLWLAGLLGCTSGGANIQTTVTNLRVITAVSSQPEVAPGESFSVDVHLLDAEDEPRDVGIWFCTLYGDGCAEAGPTPRDLAAFSQVWRDASLDEQHTFEVPAEIDLLLTGANPSRPYVFWALTCRPGACPILDELADPPDAGSAAWTNLIERLARPTGWLAEVPYASSSFAARSWLVSRAVPFDRHRNPRLARADGVGLVRAVVGEAVVLSFDTDPATLYPFSTAGGFGEESYPALHGRVFLTWYAPDVPGDVDLVVVAEDGAGGSALWRGTARVSDIAE